MTNSLQEKIIKAYESAVELRNFDIPTEREIKEVMPLPDNFKKRVEKIVGWERRYIYLWGNRISKVAVVIILLFMTGITVYAVVKSKFFYQIFQHNTEVSIVEEEMIQGEEYIKDVYYPSETLDFKQDSVLELDTSIIAIYKNPKAETITYIQQVIQAQYSYDNESTAEQKVEVAGVEC